MVQKLFQSQEQKLVQQQRLTQQQMLQVKLLEMPLAELEESVRTELDDNPALEAQPTDDPSDYEETDLSSEPTENDGIDDYEREERQDALDAALERLGGDDEMPAPTWYGGQGQQNADYEEITYGDQTSFYDTLRRQMAETELTEKEQEVMEYLIGSLDNDGLLRKDISDISDELAVQYYIDASEEEIEKVLNVLQGFDPAGIGARSLQECLLLQIDRREPSTLHTMMKQVISECFDDFMNKRWSRIAKQLNMSEEVTGVVRQEILKLNPKPGSSLGETEGRSIQQITPDFIVDTADDGTVTFTITRGHVPDLFVSPEFADLVDEYQRNRENMNRQQKEALLYAREKVERAKGYIEAVKQRRRTLYVTMKAIIDMQKKYFQDGDESDLQPMVLKDIAERTNLDISTVSRVCNAKYAQTRWGTFRLRHFFNEGVRTGDGMATSSRMLKATLRDIVNDEDKRNPMNDDDLAAEMKKRGYPIARRTVSKYRLQMGIPSARLRKE